MRYLHSHFQFSHHQPCLLTKEIEDKDISINWGHYWRNPRVLYAWHTCREGSDGRSKINPSKGRMNSWGIFWGTKNLISTTRMRPILACTNPLKIQVKLRGGKTLKTNSLITYNVNEVTSLKKEKVLGFRKRSIKVGRRGKRGWALTSVSPSLSF